VNPLSSHRTRRATTDDLEPLKALWLAERLDAGELEKQLTDFQVGEDEQGAVAAAIALQISGSQGRIHSETIADFAQTDLWRPRLWFQLQSAAQNHGLFRLWTRETAPFWRRDAGFTDATREWLEKLPVDFGAAGPGWLALRIRDEAAEPEALERQFEVFKISEQEKRDKVLRRASLLRFLGTFIAILLFASGFLLLLWVFKHRTR
jgi:N-acetylglutamate synthase-like GNAT family acetyltransferase